MLTIKYQKTGSAIYISHIDTLRGIIRAIRRAGLDVAYSDGFNPHPRLYLSPPLPLFAASLAEYFSVETEETAEEFFERYKKACPPGLPPVKIFFTPKNPNLAGKLFAADYMFSTDAPVGQDLLDGFLSRESIPFVNRAGKEKDVRPFIYGLTAEQGGARARLDSNGIRPDALAAEIEKTLGVRVKAATKTAQYARLGDGLIEADSFLTELSHTAL
ncbi:MAG: TIGR03936 family radical SAM-associated protein [Clostridiales bacterium]|jgi:radical SAM-linked protein|nr:TIGR03936 family radical SAM-associated protein [Clostridiales bacterium]